MSKAIKAAGGLIIATLVVLLIMLIYFNARGLTYYFDNLNVRFPRVKISSIYDQLKTGDVLLFISNVHGFSNSFGTRCLFSHAALVVEGEPNALHPPGEPNALHPPGEPMDAISNDAISNDAISKRFYVSENSATSKLMPYYINGAYREIDMPVGGSFSPLLTRLKYYSGTVYLMSLRNPLPEQTEKILFLKARSAVGASYATVMDMVMGWFIPSYKCKGTHCFQHVAKLLTESGIVSVDTSIGGSSNALSDLGGGSVYKKPVQLVYDIDCNA